MQHPLNCDQMSESPSSRLSCQSVPRSDVQHPCVRDFETTIPVDVVRVEMGMIHFLDLSVAVRISVNALDVIPTGAKGMCSVTANGLTVNNILANIHCRLTSHLSLTMRRPS